MRLLMIVSWLIIRNKLKVGKKMKVNQSSNLLIVLLQQWACVGLSKFKECNVWMEGTLTINYNVVHSTTA